MLYFSTEITSSTITSDSPLHARTKKAYELVKQELSGTVLEIGSGEGYGLQVITPHCSKLIAIDKSKWVIRRLQKRMPKVKAIHEKAPPLKQIADNSVDFVLLFQVIEHIDQDQVLLREIHRVLRPGGSLYLTTPNREQTIVKNPWHVREYIQGELQDLLSPLFGHVELQGVTGSTKVMNYYKKHQKRVEAFIKKDRLKLHARLPNVVIKIGYEILNRRFRKKSYKSNPDSKEITSSDYVLSSEITNETLDFFCKATKKNEAIF